MAAANSYVGFVPSKCLCVKQEGIIEKDALDVAATEKEHDTGCNKSCRVVSPGRGHQSILLWLSPFAGGKGEDKQAIVHSMGMRATENNERIFSIIDHTHSTTWCWGLP